MPDTIRRLLQSHEFLHRALQLHGPKLAAADRERMQQERDGIVLELIKYPSSEPRITLAQFNILIGSLADLCDDSEMAEILTQSCREAAERLVRQSARQKAMNTDAQEKRNGKLQRNKAVLQQMRLMDSLPDRAGVIDRNYRYVWTNKANADFYGIEPATFVDVPLSEQIGNKAFSELSKAHIDTSLNGRSLLHVTGHYARGRWFKYLISYDPVRNDDNEIEAVLIVARDVSNMPVEPQFIWPARDA